jgi:hypothetical protein
MCCPPLTHSLTHPLVFEELVALPPTPTPGQMFVAPREDKTVSWKQEKRVQSVLQCTNNLSTKAASLLEKQLGISTTSVHSSSR